MAFPSVEVGAGFTAGGIAGGSRAAKSYGHAGPELTLGFHLDGRYGVDVPISLLQTWAGVNGSWATLGFRPAFILSLTTKDVMLSVRGGPDVLVPLDAPRSTPSAFIGGHVGASVLFLPRAFPTTATSASASRCAPHYELASPGRPRRSMKRGSASTARSS